MKIAGKVAVVTGGASGIGQSVVRALVERGARVAIFDLNDSAGLAMEKEGGSAVLYAGANVVDEAASAGHQRLVFQAKNARSERAHWPALEIALAALASTSLGVA